MLPENNYSSYVLDYLKCFTLTLFFFFLLIWIVIQKLFYSRFAYFKECDNVSMKGII